MTDRKEIWKHNSFLGMAKMAEKNMLAITKATTVTPEAAQVALQIYHNSRQLYTLLKQRKAG